VQALNGAKGTGEVKGGEKGVTIGKKLKMRKKKENKKSARGKSSNPLLKGGKRARGTDSKQMKAK